MEGYFADGFARKLFLWKWFSEKLNGGLKGALINKRKIDRKSTRLNSSHSQISYAVFCLKKKTKTTRHHTTPLQSKPQRTTATLLAFTTPAEFFGISGTAADGPASADIVPESRSTCHADS